MTRFAHLCAVALLSGAAFSQSSETAPAFEISDVHLSATGSTNLFRRGPVMRGGRYELRTATMVDLVAAAYGFQNDKVLGGPSWLEMTRFDVIAKAPPDSTLETVKPALQKLLADRFKLVVHKDTKPLPTYALMAGKKPLLKEAAGSEQSGCKPQTGAPGAGGGMIMIMGADGAPQTFTLGPGMTVQYQCRNMTMEAFAAGLRGMFGAAVGTNPVLDQTDLKGNWNFDVRWSVGMGRGPDADERISLFDAVEKQLGLKLEQKQVPTPVIVVDSVNEKPTDNPPDLAERLKIPPPPTEFEVAALKPSDPDARRFRTQIQPGGRVNIQGMPLKSLVMQAWNLRNDMLAGAPSWMDTDRYDIIAKVSSSEPIDLDAVWPLVRKLLTDRFQMTTHNEERPATAYTLTLVKPKMKKADPATRSHIQNGPPSDGKDTRTANPALSRSITCQNVTMAQFAAQLQPLAGGYLQSPVLDATGLEGGWDFTLNFSPAGMAQGGGRRGGDGSPAGGVEASDPGGGISLFDAIEKQLGLKLQAQKRPVSVLVIDHIERKPTDN
jgi:uncharacterized protein (TIGR03435 family)